MSAILALMRRWIGAIVVGGLLWGMWSLLWRGAEWPILVVGVLFPAATLGATKVGILPMNFPLGAWLRVDLWAAFALAVTALTIVSVARTGWAILTGHVRSGIIAIPIRVRSEMGQLLLLWAITVTPGTIALLVEENTAYVHCLHRPTGPCLPGTSRVENLLVRLWG